MRRSSRRSTGPSRASCNDDSRCEGITVNWLDAGEVECYKRGGIDPKKCRKTPKGTYSTFTKDSPSPPTGTCGASCSKNEDCNPSGGFWHHKCQTSHGTRCYGHCVEK